MLEGTGFNTMQRRGDSSIAEKGEDPANERNGAEQRDGSKVSIKNRLEHFTWPWFSCTMATGSVAVVLNSTPNRFPGLNTIGAVFFIADLVLFLTFTGLMIFRFSMAPYKLTHTLHHPVEGLFFGTYFVSIALILNCIQLYGTPRCGPWLHTALQILFWMYCAIVLLVAIFQYYVFFQNERLQVKDAVPAWIFPIYPLLVVGPLAGNILKDQGKGASYPIWVGAVMIQGLSWTVAIMMYSIYVQRLMTSSLPSPSSRPGMYVSVGPAGYTAAGLLSLSSIAPEVIPNNAFDIQNVRTGEIVQVVGIMAGTFIILFAFWFCCISTLAVLMGMRRMQFTLTWWAFVFPNAGMTLGAIQLGKAYNSRPINGICSALTIALVIAWILVAIFNIKAVWQRRILWPGKDEDTPEVVPKNVE